jgi:hypothetical protein
MQQHVILRLLIIDFVSNVYESPHDEIHGGIFILNVLDKTHFTTYIE